MFFLVYSSMGLGLCERDLALHESEDIGISYFLFSYFRIYDYSLPLSSFGLLRPFFSICTSYTDCSSRIYPVHTMNLVTKHSPHEQRLGRVLT